MQERPCGATAKPLYRAVSASSFGTSQTCRGCRENFSLPGCGAEPHIPINQSINPFVSFVIAKNNLAVLRAVARP